MAAPKRLIGHLACCGGGIPAPPERKVESPGAGKRKARGGKQKALVATAWFCVVGLSLSRQEANPNRLLFAASRRFASNSS